MLQAGGLITITLSDRVQLSQCFAREFSHAKVTLLQESRRDRYRAYELNKANIAFILVKPQNLSFSNWMLQADDKLIPRKSHSTVRLVFDKKEKAPWKKRMSRNNINSQNDPMPCLCYFISFPHCFLIHYFIFRYRELVF